MINLLPSVERKELRAGLTNGLLLRYVFFTAGVTGAVIVLIALTFIYLKTVETSANNTTLANDQKAVEFSDVESKAAAFNSDLALAKQIMDNETHYTELLTTLAGSLPPGVVMDQVALDATTFGTSTVFSFQANSYQTAIKLKNSLQNSSMFRDVSFASLAQSTESGSGYPFTVQLNLTIVKPSAEADS